MYFQLVETQVLPTQGQPDVKPAPPYHGDTDHFHELLVDVVEALRLLRQTLDDVTAGENRLHVLPHVLHHQPHLYDVRHGGQLHDPLLHLVLEIGFNRPKEKTLDVSI